MKKTSLPQLTLRLDAAAPADAWHAGGQLRYLGGSLTLVLDTACRLPERAGTELHLPLPPAASSRQIRDAAESWLRDEASRLFGQILENLAAAGRHAGPMPRIVLSFSKRSDWAKGNAGILRCHWRLVEQPRATIEQVLDQAWARMAHAQRSDDLFALA